jgi:hypothetical protein
MQNDETSWAGYRAGSPPRTRTGCVMYLRVNFSVLMATERVVFVSENKLEKQYGTTTYNKTHFIITFGRLDPVYYT